MGWRATRVRTLSTLILVGCGIYALLDVVVQTLPPHYSPIHQAESDLAVGPYGSLMDINFILRGALTLCLVGVLATVLPERARSRLGMFALTLWGATSALLAFFPTDILDDRRLVPHPHATLPGEVHLALATIGFIAAALGALLTSVALHRGSGTPARAPLALALLSVAALLLLPLAGRFHHAGGLAERLFLAAVLAWTAALAIRFRAMSAMARADQQVPPPVSP